MRNNFFIRLFTSLPIILLSLWFFPFLGICLMILKLFVNRRNKLRTPIHIILAGVLILVPKGISLLTDVVKFDLNSIPYLNQILNSKFYNTEMVEYSKYLICFGVIFLIIFVIFKTIFEKLSNTLNSGILKYIQESQKRDYEISKQNDLKIKLKQEKAKNTHYVKCPNCGSDNLVGDKFAVCKYCRSKLENKHYKG